MEIGHTELAIVVIAYLVGISVKANPKIKDDWIPPIVGTVGAVLGLIGYFLVPDFPAENVLNALSTGIVSGLASVGINQTYKRFSNKKGEQLDG